MISRQHTREETQQQDRENIEGRKIKAVLHYCRIDSRKKRNEEDGKVKHRKMQRQLKAYEQYLREEERSPATVEKYTRIVRGFFCFAEERAGGKNIIRHIKKDMTKETVCAYKQHLIDEGASPSTVNSELSAIRSYLKFIGREDIHVKNMKCQRSPYVSEQKLLKRSEYEKMLEKAAQRGEEKLQLIIETICSTGIRVSELSYMTVEAVEQGEAEIRLKGKTRKILIPSRLRKKLKRHLKASNIDEGPLFRNSKGDPIHRSSVWAMMKKLARKAGIDPSKAFPHNLRRLFARTFYRAKNDIAKLADVLGHSSIDTTRIYIATTADEHMKILDELQFVT